MASMSGAAQSDALKALSYKAAVYRLTRILKQRQKRLDRSYIVLTLALISIVVIVLLAVLDQIDRAAAITLVVGAVAVALNAAFSSLSAGEPSQKELKGLLKGFGFNAVSASELKRFHEQAKRFARDEAALAQLRQALLQANKPVRDLHSLRDVINGSSAPTSEALKILRYNAALRDAIRRRRDTDEEIYDCFRKFTLDRPAAHELEIFRAEMEHSESLQILDALQRIKEQNTDLWRMIHMPPSKVRALLGIAPEREDRELSEEKIRAIKYEAALYKAVDRIEKRRRRFNSYLTIIGIIAILAALADAFVNSSLLTLGILFSVLCLVAFFLPIINAFSAFRRPAMPDRYIHNIFKSVGLDNPTE